MPSQRKRIGFLPRVEVQIIIDQICRNNKLSQSKVTGILVEEALISRGVLKSKYIGMNRKLDMSKLIIENNINTNTQSENENLNLDERYINEEVSMIKDYIEFKFFKNIMKKNAKDI